jgi:hypothetical protein
MVRAALAIAITAISIGTARAECTCQCVNGAMQPLCDSAINVPPICPPTVCPIMAPSVTPIDPPTILPIGTSECHQARVCGTFGNCRSQQVCE